jgi:hypothetical protein
MTSATVQTSAQPIHHQGDLLEFTGTLTEPAQERIRLLDSEALSVPVVCMTIELDHGAHNVMRVEQRFPPDHHAQARAAAHRLKKGTHVTVQVPIFDLQIVARNVSHIHVINDQT